MPLGILVLDELRRRRPDLRFVLYGNDRPVRTPFPYEDLGVVSPERLSWAYSEATVGLSLSLTNYSLIPQEMLACGLPVVEVAGLSMEQVFGADGPVELAPPDVMELANAIERLLDDPALRERRAAGGIEFVRTRTWDSAADQLEAALREALRLREDGADDEASPRPSRCRRHLRRRARRRGGRTPGSSRSSRTPRLRGPSGCSQRSRTRTWRRWSAASRAASSTTGTASTIITAGHSPWSTASGTRSRR